MDSSSPAVLAKADSRTVLWECPVADNDAAMTNNTPIADQDDGFAADIDEDDLQSPVETVQTPQNSFTRRNERYPVLEVTPEGQIYHSDKKKVASVNAMAGG